MKFSRTVPFVMALVFAASNLTALAQTKNPEGDWQQFRGVNQMGVARKGVKPPVEWDLEKNSVWQRKLPGTGWSSPVYAEGKVWVTTAIAKKASRDEIARRKREVKNPQIKTVAASVDLRVLCIDVKSGEIVHNKSLRNVKSPDMINPLNSYASPTAAISGGKVVCHFGSYGTWCLDTSSGDVLWDRKYVVDHSVGPGSSPVIFGKTVLLVCDGMDKQFIVGLDLETGKQNWLTNRPPIRKKNPEFKKAYSTPLLIKIDGSDQAVIPGAQWLISYDPKTGKEFWRVDHGGGFSVTPMAIYHQGMIVFSTGYGRPQFVGVDPSGSGDVTRTHVKWKRQNAPAMPSFVAVGGEIFSVNDRGILFRLDVKTGEVLERVRVGGNFSASPILAGNHLYLSSREGVMSVFRFDEEFQKVASNQFDSPLMASPVVIGNDLIVRTRDKIYRISK